MAPRQLYLLVFLCLGACFDHNHPIPPADPPAQSQSQLLSAGSYVLVVDDVAALSCSGASPRELVGQQIGAELAITADQVVLDLDGWVLAGDMIPGAIFVEGEQEAVVVDEEGEVDYDDDEEVPPAGGEDSSGSAGDESDCGEEEEGEEPGVPVEEAPSRVEGFAALDAQILDSDHAVGRLTVIMSGCAMELEVSLEAGEYEAPIDVEEDEDVASGASGGSSGSSSDEEADCG